MKENILAMILSIINGIEIRSFCLIIGFYLVFFLTFLLKVILFQWLERFREWWFKMWVYCMFMQDCTLKNEGNNFKY